MSTRGGSQEDGADLKGFVEIATKLLVAFVAVGYLVVVIHFARYGYFAVSMFQVQLAMASAWVFLPPTLAWVFMSRAALPFTRRYLWGSPFQKKVGWLAILVLYALVLASSVAMLFFYNSDWVASRDWPDRLIIVTSATCLLVSIPLGIVVKGRIRRLRGIARLRLFLKEAPLCLLLVMAVLYLTEFEYLYEAVPHFLGGGQPAIVRIIAEPSEQKSLRVMGMEFPAGNSVSEPVRLLLSTPENYVLSIGEHGSLAEVPRDLVKAIVYGEHRAQDPPAGGNGS